MRKRRWMLACAASIVLVFSACGKGTDKLVKESELEESL